MSKDLDKNLEEMDLEFLHGVPVHLTKPMIEQIKQVFVNAGRYNESHKVSCAVTVECPKCGESIFYERQHLFPDDIQTAPFEEKLTKSEWEQQALKDGWRLHPKDEDYVFFTKSYIDQMGKTGYMTGQEWYNKFVYEYKSEWSYDKGMVHTEEALSAAKKAAGIE